MKTRTKVKAGGILLNHNQTTRPFKVKTCIKAGKLSANHSQTARSFKVKTRIKAGLQGDAQTLNHNQTMRAARG